MRWIDKGSPPEGFEKWKKEHHPNKWSDLPGNLPHDPESTIAYYSKNQLRKILRQEQFEKCLYCETEISCDPLGTKIDHVRIPRSSNNVHSIFEYNNLGLSCNGGERDGKLKRNRIYCDTSKGNRTLPFTPYDQFCEEKLRFSQIGTVSSTKNDGKDVIQILNLNVAKLINLRKEAISGMIMDKNEQTYISSQEAKKIYDRISPVKTIPYSKAILDSLRLLF